MSTTAYVLLADAQQRARIDAALARCVDRVVFLDAIDALPAAAAESGHDCLIVSVDATEPDAVKTIGELRAGGNPIGVIVYDPSRDTMFVNFEGLKIRTPQDVAAVRDAIEQRCGAIGKKASVVANYDGFELDEEQVDAWAAAAQALSERHYRHVGRYTTSAFMRLKLGEALDARGVQPHLFETQREAMDFARHRPK